MMSNVFDFFDKIYYLNPDDNFKRKEELQKEFSKYNIIAERISGTKLSMEQSDKITKNGGILCDRTPERLPYLAAVRSVTLSHLTAISLAKYQKFKNLLIFEDDVMFSENFTEDLFSCLQDLENFDWNMFFLGCNPVEPFDKVTNNISKCGGIYMTHAYVVNHTFYDELLKFNFSNFWVFDQYIFGLTRGKNNNIFMSNKNLVKQKPGFSGAENQYVDYNIAVDHNYKKNFVDL